MAHVSINISKIKYNAKVLQTIFQNNNMQFTPVIKCIAGDRMIVNSLKDLGITHVAESRLDNIVQIDDEDLSYTLIRTPAQRDIPMMIEKVDMSIQTELSTIYKINEVAESLGKKHKILLMVDWKDSREGVLTYDVLEYIKKIIHLKNIHFVGLAFNFMCFKSDAPTDDDIFMINRFVTAVEREIGYRLKIISGGNSSMLPQLLYNDLGKINELRIGETLFRGVDTTTNQTIAMLYQDAITIEAEILEIKPRINATTHESFLQAIVDIGYLDTKVDNINPLDQYINILGASSDHLMLDLNGQGHYQVGDHINFSLNYEALSHSMYMKNLHKIYVEDSKIDTLLQNFDVQSPAMVNQY
ncbi:ornithine racemase SfnaC [Staphylococcus sp. SS35]|nr:ornithine racemase SfnaC [Staphylococcus singaporensis]UMT80222.1 ornithine racemase SfnaC [Staphylococcus roterodami]